MKQAKYRVTGFFGFREKGEILDCTVITTDEDSGRSLIYIPPSRKHGECGCFEICKFDWRRRHYVSVGKSAQYVNIGKLHRQLKNVLYGSY